MDFKFPITRLYRGLDTESECNFSKRAGKALRGLLERAEARTAEHDNDNKSYNTSGAIRFRKWDNYVLNNIIRLVLTVYLDGDGLAKNSPTSGWNLSPISSILEWFNFGLGPRCHFSYLSIASISEVV
jgi:hypothetical protein